jgi:hypothetical protein
MQIMKIEDQIKSVINGKKYIKIRQYVNVLKDLSGNAILEVENPNDMGKAVKLRKNSIEAKEYLERYELMLTEYDTLLLELRKRKKSLNTELFG